MIGPIKGTSVMFPLSVLNSLKYFCIPMKKNTKLLCPLLAKHVNGSVQYKDVDTVSISIGTER
jgi:hypothetical protein